MTRERAPPCTVNQPRDMLATRSTSIVLVFLNFLALFFIGLFLSHNTGFLLPMFSPDGLYLVPSSD